MSTLKYEKVYDMKLLTPGTLYSFYDPSRQNINIYKVKENLGNKIIDIYVKHFYIEPGTKGLTTEQDCLKGFYIISKPFIKKANIPWL